MIKDPNIDTRRTFYSLITDGKVNDGVKAAHGSKCINRYEWIDINNLRNVTFLTFSIIAHLNGNLQYAEMNSEIFHITSSRFCCDVDKLSLR